MATGSFDSLPGKLDYYLHMLKQQRNSGVYRVSQALAVAIFLCAGPGNAAAYSSYHARYGVHNYGYHGHYSLHAHYSSHGGIGTAGYVILGLFGAVLLSHLLNSDNYPPRGTYHRTYPVHQPFTYQRPATPVKRYSPAYHYNSEEGWDALAKGNAGFALDVFAVQTQEEMGNGIPRIGFALAAAASGELERGARAMRKALSIDPEALENIRITPELELIIDLLTEEYTAAAKTGDRDFDYSFMIATLSFLKQDYSAARNMIAGADQSHSAGNLREILGQYP
jgi:hypothetical protein